MNLLNAIFLGFIQGATEFLPISSSGHLVIAEHFLGIKQVGLPFDVSLHMGTLLAILVYFRHDFLLMGKSLVRRSGNDKKTLFHRRLSGFICIAGLPAVIAALMFGHAAETFLRDPLIVVVTLSGAGLLLLLAEKKATRSRELHSISLTDAIIIGLFQAIAIIPGVSRSGITMTAGLFRGLDRQAVARFSFLMSAPIVFGAGVYNIPAIIEQGLKPDIFPFYLAGFISSAVSGYIFIAFLLKFIRTHSFEVFAYYRFALSAAVLLFMWL